ncbi:MAG: MBL fold metallo-hydrolase [Sphingobacteriales bacterium]|nr:MAG: MBL fold metallo-hydrolase [Sphingobacteriales bacterium]
MTIIPLSEGEFTIGFDKIFVPFHSGTDVLEDRPRGSLLVEIQPFLIELGDRLMLCDTGLGFKGTTGKQQIHENLARLGYGPEDVTHVLLSHLHKDHAGGLLFETASGFTAASFPDATHYIYRPEWDFALEKGAPSYTPSDFEGLENLVDIEWLQGEKGQIGEALSWQHSGAHCPQHIIWTIQDGSEIAFFGGDEAPQLKQMKMRYVARYDADGEKAMRLREQYGTQGREEGWTFLFYHDIGAPTAVLKS